MKTRASLISAAFFLIAMDANAGKHYETNAGCRLIGRTLYRLGEQRDLNVPIDQARRRVHAWLQEINRTGSHQRRDLRQQVADLATFVWEQGELDKATLYQFGVHSCGLGMAVDYDPNKSSLGSAQLSQAAAECQRVFPGRAGLGPRRECLRKRADKLIGEFTRSAP